MDSLVSNQYDVRTNFLLGNPNLVYKIMIRLGIDPSEREDLYYDIIAQSLERPCNYDSSAGRITTYSWNFVAFQLKRYLRDKVHRRPLFLGDRDIMVRSEPKEHVFPDQVQKLFKRLKQVATEQEYRAACYYFKLESLRDTGKAMGITGERVRQLLNNISNRISKEGLIGRDF